MTLTLTVGWHDARVGGAFVTTDGVGALRSLPNEGLTQGPQGLTHTAPKPASEGAVTFRFAWQAPTAPGAVTFRVAALAGNGNNASSGDAPGLAEFSWAFGCEARELFVDLDRDGYGAAGLGQRLGCLADAPPAGLAAQSGDCDENDEAVHPGTAEVCNGRDDDCDASIDEGAAPVPMWPDADGDGYYAQQSGSSKLGCGNLLGYAPNPGDCDDANTAVHPAAAETCNERDDDCDGEVDELVRPQCGLGWCSRYSTSCDLADCRPGAPAIEQCNQFDDDCDGEDDNGVCRGGAAASGAPAGTGSDGAASGGNGAPAAPNAASRSDGGCSFGHDSGGRDLVAVGFVALVWLRRRRFQPPCT